MAEDKKVICLVDDELTSLMLGKKILAKHYKVFTMDSGAAFLEFLENGIPDLILLDIVMPEMNGYDVIKIIKSKAETKDIPVIFLTGKTDEDNELEGLSLGAIDYITKPFSASILLKRVEIHLNMAEKIKKYLGVKSSKRVRVQTFGKFEVFVDDEPVVFARFKTNELFAYLISRKGKLCTNNEIISVIWKNKEDSSALQSNFRNLVADLIKTFRALNVEDIIIKERNCLAVVPDKLSCDFYEAPNGCGDGKFMTQYEWAGKHFLS